MALANCVIILASVTIKYMKQKHIVLLAALIVLALAGYFYINRNNEAAAPEITNENVNVAPTEGTENTIPENTNTAGNVSGADTIIVTEQSAGSAVTIDNVNLSKPGFLVIHADNNGQVGAAVGYSGYLSAGPKQDLEVKATIVAGGKYWAEIHWDNGDKKLNAALDQSVYKTQFSVSQ
jgi:hypothetical protein